MRRRWMRRRMRRRRWSRRRWRRRKGKGGRGICKKMREEAKVHANLVSCPVRLVKDVLHQCSLRLLAPHQLLIIRETKCAREKHTLDTKSNKQTNKQTSKQTSKQINKQTNDDSRGSDLTIGA